MTKTKQKPAMCVINVRILKKRHSALLKEAKAKGITLAQVVRNAIEAIHGDQGPQ